MMRFGRGAGGEGRQSGNLAVCHLQKQDAKAPDVGPLIVADLLVRIDHLGAAAAVRPDCTAPWRVCGGPHKL